ncbi:peptidoglycan DD-metalloendopeptidase family protein [Pseudoalteromonas sp. MMG010]|uniref:M23 family metallopeptidase n=1 Tax=Pseudoalteromonas sp. MMG010 TaxID=2822685 RepID=UPI001B3A1E3B|nr:M23 family metallopeptidase [Pseudoalteromonas sp. MMG010]MBQ4833102.1 peptidoglycan DD-metalloendopeptidase family protein [Pseudoalteromonas sp. MMG010]
MSLFIKSFYHRCFPTRQLLIRQNGEVKHLVLAPWLQLFTILALCITLIWVTVSSFRIYNQTNKITHIEQSQQTKQTLWQHQIEQQKALQTQQREQLAILEQKQILLQSMIESLPASISNETIDSINELTIPIDEKSDFHEPLVEASNKQAALTYSDAFSTKYEQLTKAYQNNFLYLEKQIESRHKTILNMLEGAGLELALAQHLAQTKPLVAQGGPYNNFDESKLPKSFLTVADKLLALNNLESFLTELPNALPLEKAKYYISSQYGLRKDPMNNRKAFHKGVDLAGWHKTEIFAPANGTVLRAGRNGGYGNFIEIQHKNGLVTRFGHLNKIKVKKGQIVAKNDVIGLMGSTGRSTSTHLHYEVLLDGNHINPLKITKALSRVR